MLEVMLVGALLAGHAERPAKDEAAAAFEACRAKLAAARTAAGTVTFTPRFGQERRLEFRVMKPDLYMILSGPVEEYFDGHHLWRYLMRSKMFQRIAVEISEMPLSLRGFSSFFPGGRESFRIRRYEMGRSGDAAAAVAFGRTDSGADVRLYVDPVSHLPQGWSEGDGVAETSARLLDLRLDIPLDPASFQWRPPVDVVEAQMPDVEAIGPKVGSRAPEVLVTDLDGTPRPLSDALRGKEGLLVLFWHISCPPCRVELPYLERMSASLAEQGLGVVCINIGDSADAIRSYRAETNLSLPFVMDGTAEPTAVRAFGVVTYPTTYLLDAQGVVRTRIMGFDKKALRAALREFRAKKE